MSTKLIRFVVILAIIAAVAGNGGVVSATPLFAPTAANPLGVQFVHIATAANTAFDVTTIDHPLANGNPAALIFVTPDYNPGGAGGVYLPHAFGVKYAGGKWLIFNQDGLPIPAGAAFNVIIATANAFVQTSTAVGNDTTINNVLTDLHPNAILLVTPNYTPGGVCGCVPNNHNIGVFYSGGKWIIFNQDHGNVMPVGTAFNVLVLTAGTGIFVHTTTGANINGSSTEIDNPLTNANPNALVFATQNYNPGNGVTVMDNNHPTGVYYNSVSHKWAIFNQDGAIPAVDAAFNVLVLAPISAVFVHTNTITGATYTLIDNALTDSNPNALVFTTPNWNPGGVGGTGHNHNTGMYFNGGQWAILNQDAALIPVGTAFNILVPNPDASVFVQQATAANIIVHSTVIDYPLTNGNPNAILFVTPNWKPGGVCGCIYDNHPIGVFYDGSKWRIFNQDGAAMPVDATFNVFVPAPGPGIFVHTVTLSNGGYSTTLIDNPLSNANPNAIVLVTPNWNPGGVGGVNANFPIGVRYESVSQKWAIFSQDGTSMIPTTAFNVYIFGNRRFYLPLAIH